VEGGEIEASHVGIGLEIHAPRRLGIVNEPPLTRDSMLEHRALCLNGHEVDATAGRYGLQLRRDTAEELAVVENGGASRSKQEGDVEIPVEPRVTAIDPNNQAADTSGNARSALEMAAPSSALFMHGC
jgi:hypothetical protein